MSAGAENSFNWKMVSTVLLGVLVFVLGASLGAVSLISQQVREVTVLPEPEQRVAGTVYYRKGAEAPGARWRIKRNQVVREDPGLIRFSESDLNDWSRNSFQQSAIPAPTAAAPEGGADGVDTAETAEPKESKPLLGIERKASPPNFAFVDGQLQISSQLELPSTLGSRRFIYQVVGDLETEEDGRVRFVPERGFLGGAPLVSIPLLGPSIHAHIAGYFEQFPEWQEIASHWGAVSAISIEGDELLLTVEQAAL